MPATADDFRDALGAWLREAEGERRRFLELSAGDLHRCVGDYPGPAHRMPVSCRVMRECMRADDTEIGAPPKGNGASLTVRYQLPR